MNIVENSDIPMAFAPSGPTRGLSNIVDIVLNIISVVVVILFITSIIVNIVKWKKYNSKQRKLAVIGIAIMFIISAIWFFLFHTVNYIYTIE